MPLRNLAWLLIVPAVLALGFVACYSAPAPDKEYRLVGLIVKVLATVDEKFYRELDDKGKQKLVEDMIDGGLRRLDPYSEFLTEAKIKQFEEEAAGGFGGVGIQLGIDYKTRRLKVEYPMPGTPAYDAGVFAGDLIIKVGNEATPVLPEKYTDRDLQEAVEWARKRITGDVNTPVILTTRREGRNPTDLAVQLTRGQIATHQVIGVARRPGEPTKWEWFIDPVNKIALIRLRSFMSEHVTRELAAAVTEIEQAGGRAIIIDLRDNGGGLLDQAVGVADLFLADGMIVSTKNRAGSTREFKAKEPGTLFLPTDTESRPIAVLVNGSSASASEIVSAALQDHGRAIIVGSRTFGKGSVQQTFEVSKSPRAAVKLTVETYWRPSGKNIHRAPDSKPTDEWGVKPNPGMEVRATEEEELRYTWEVWKSEYVAGRPDLVGPNPPPPQIPRNSQGKPRADDSKPFEDRVLNKALEELRKKLQKVGRAPAPAAPAPAAPPLNTAA